MALELSEILQQLDAGALEPLYLVVGEEFLARQAADELIRKVLPSPEPGLNYVIADGASPREIAQELATLPLFPGRKVVYVRDPEFMAPKKGRGDALSKVRDAWKAGRRKEAGRRLLALAARAGWTMERLTENGPSPVTAQQWKDELDVELAGSDEAFLREVVAFCVDEKITAPEGDDGVLVDLLEKGLPPGHVLVVAITQIDAKSPLLRLATAKGGLVKRTVESRLDRLDLSAVIALTLKGQDKRLDPRAEVVLKERVGGNMRLAQSELEKLALFVDGKVITEKDVRLLVGHAREDEYSELSDALQKRNYLGAATYLADALARDQAPLALLGAITSIVRNLLVSSERLAHLTAGGALGSYKDFQAQLLPKIEAELKAAKQRVPHPYGLYMSMTAAGRFQRRELLACLSLCAECDLALKHGGGALVLERLLWAVCGHASPWDAGLLALRRDADRA